MAEVRNDELNIEERRSKIMEILTQEGRVKVNEMSRMFAISEVTIRNDLSELENAGLLERVHGGAISTNKAYYNMSLHDRMKTNEEAKRRIALEVASFVSEGDTLMVNSGTTTLFVMQELRNVKNLTVVTNSISIAQEIGHYKNMQMILLGGSFNPLYQFTYGDDTINQLKRYKADKLILATDGVSSEDGITTYLHFEAEVNRQMIARVNKTIVVADHTKIGRASFAHIDSIESVDYLVTNKTANQEDIKAIVKKGLDVRLV